MNRSETTRQAEFPIPLSAAADWPASMAGGGPVFRQLPHDDGKRTAGDRRGAERRDVQLGIEIYGYDGQLSLVHAYGTTQDVSASGLFANVDVDLPVGSRAVVALQPSRPSLEPSILRGRVVRCDADAEGYGLAIHFDLDASQFIFEAA